MISEKAIEYKHSNAGFEISDYTDGKKYIITEKHTATIATQTECDSAQMELREYFNYCNHQDNLEKIKNTWLAHDYGKLRYLNCHPART